MHVSGATFDWFDAELPEQIAREISLVDYEIIEHTDGRRAALTQALERLAAAHPDGFARVREFVRGLLWVGLKPGVRASSLTSSSDPALPYVIAFSEKARHHIPPNTVSSEPSHLFLAENLLHEAVHQSVSFHVLQHQVFADGYSSKTSPRSRSRGALPRGWPATSSGRWTGPSTRPAYTTTCCVFVGSNSTAMT